MSGFPNLSLQASSSARAGDNRSINVVGNGNDRTIASLSQLYGLVNAPVANGGTVANYTDERVSPSLQPVVSVAPKDVTGLVLVMGIVIVGVLLVTRN